MTDHAAPTQDYTPPALTPLGSVHQLTQTPHPKTHGPSDGFTFMAPVTHVSL